ncbi:DUF799 domain-containing protein [Paraburkholderia silviterrae]|uniref:Lipoprotein n=1 Tax=Paraburkholderia silviterrae TaxID=2528715 RepID=A0A4R5MCW6_9BURK|nr:DUF799 domain-containing protein [Paraburkholderia silviterrae]TDG24443.1 hypothetical protein EYW47_07715 [Paraburkholderia silviterrae]
MLNFSFLKCVPVLALAALLAACAGPQKSTPGYDYTAFKSAKPKSILVLPPLNETADVNATNGMLSQMTMPLAESGYYVLPVAEVAETFRQNGMTMPAEMQATSPKKLRDIFGADAALYTKVTQYGSVYQVVDSNTVVAASAKLVSLGNGDVLWEGSASANGKELGNVDFGSGSVIGMLVQAAVKQVAHSLSDESQEVAGLTSQKLLSAGPPNGLLYGPHSPKYGSD